MSNLISLVYVSYERYPMTNDDLVAILSEAKTHNSTENITGMLLYRNGYFIQALEGEDEKVTALYNLIARDERHKNVLLVEKNPITERSFGEWTMGFRNLDDVDPNEFPGFTDFLSRPVEDTYFTENSSRARELLNTFREEVNY